MTGLIDVGGGLRGIYGAGVTDAFLDRGITFDLCIGVSAGAANMASYTSGQKGRNFPFYSDYPMRKDYMSPDNIIRKKAYLDLDYVYSVLSNEDGENPLDFDNCSGFISVATDAASGKPVYLDSSEMKKNDYWHLKASSCLPVFCKTVKRNGKAYFDGGISDPVPVEKAFELGCDRVFVILTKPVGYRKSPQSMMGLVKTALAKYPEAVRCVAHAHEAYNSAVDKLTEYEKQGKAVVIAPDDCCGVDTLTKNRESLTRLYQKGYADGIRAAEKITEGNHA